jgi:hypothetical protein
METNGAVDPHNNGLAVKATDEGAMQEALDESIQQGGRYFRTEGGASYGILRWMGMGHDIIPPWWSASRDAELRRFWKSGDHIAGAVYSVATRVTTTPFQILPKDDSVRSHMRQAETMQTLLNQYADYGQGWQVCMDKFVQDVLTQDNGGFLEVIGPGPADGPLMGAAVGIAHLDSGRCTRTSDPEFPIIYQDIDGKRYKLHYTRVIYRSQMPSPQKEMYGVGFCAVSRAIYNAQNLIDMAVYKQEKLGSRPPRQLLVGSHVSAAKILEAFALANANMDNQNLGRFSKTVVIGSGDNDISVDRVDLASVPDGFDEETSTTLAMFAIAMAFGVDARELWPATSSGATKADAMVQHLKARGKGLGQLQKMITQEINHKVLPAHLYIEFDAQDDEEDQIQSEINNMRADARGKNLTAGTITVRVARLQMLDEGEITQQQFEDMELADGRLEDGTNVLALFQSPDKEMRTLLRLTGVQDPLDVEANDPATMTRLITERIKFLQGKLFTAPNGRLKQLAQMAIAALDMLSTLYREDTEITAEDEGDIDEDAPKPEVSESDEAGDAGQEETVDDGEGGEEDSPGADEDGSGEGRQDKSIKKNVTISPDGSDQPLPEIPFDIEITERDIQRAIESFEEVFPERGDILDAEVVEKQEPANLLDMLTRQKWIPTRAGATDPRKPHEKTRAEIAHTKQSTRWQYDDSAKRYRDLNTGRFLSANSVISMRDGHQEARKEVANDLADSLTAGDITVQQYVLRMRDEIKATYIAEYMLGKGGRHNMTQADWGSLGNQLRNQYGYLQNFAQEIAAGQLSQAQIAARGRMYFSSAGQAFERARGAAYMIELPAYPKDGTSECLTNCLCNWRLVDRGDHVEATWRLSAVEHCSTCEQRGRDWAPLIVPKSA